MKERLKVFFKSYVMYIAVAVVFFVAGMVFSPNGKIVLTIKKSLSYTKGTAQKLYLGWEKENLFFANEKSFKEFEEANESYIIYFWATWCPHCANVFNVVNSFSSINLPLVAMSFDTDMGRYNIYRSEKNPVWKDIMQKDAEGNLSFCPREGSYDIPSIPSLWIVERGKVKKVFKGEKGIQKYQQKLGV